MVLIRHFRKFCSDICQESFLGIKEILVMNLNSFGWGLYFWVLIGISKLEKTPGTSSSKGFPLVNLRENPFSWVLIVVISWVVGRVVLGLAEASGSDGSPLRNAISSLYIEWLAWLNLLGKPRLLFPSAY